MAQFFDDLGTAAHETRSRFLTHKACVNHRGKEAIANHVTPESGLRHADPMPAVKRNNVNFKVFGIGGTVILAVFSQRPLDGLSSPFFNTETLEG